MKGFSVLFFKSKLQMNAASDAYQTEVGYLNRIFKHERVVFGSI